MLYSSILVAGFTVTSVVHSFGLWLLYVVKTLPQNQRILIFHLSAIEIVYSWIVVIDEPLSNSGKKAIISNFNHFYDFTMPLLVLVMRFAVLSIIFDRFLAIFLNIKYPLYVTSKRLAWTIAGEWFISCTCMISLTIHRENEDKDAAEEILGPLVIVLDTIVVLSALTTYIYFFLKVIKMKMQINDSNGGQRGVAVKKFIVPFAMVATFILFNVTCTVLTVIYLVNHSVSENTYDLIRDTTILLIMAGLLSDALIYIFLQKEVRSRLFTLFKANS